ncbi:aldo/keto reductase [Sphingomonas desiccabilis]|nr:aldo/keto reductase [Sphingomonas desiccabilis]MBB3911834.1 aryl-alcohol dehydrogenase-like predicted oxidoreductase [Sphingomonas desiccabilis]
MPAHLPPVPPAYCGSPVGGRIRSPDAAAVGTTAALRAQGMSAIGIGCARIGSLSSAQSTETAQAMFELAAARGITLFDTAGIYGGGTSEQVVGRHANRHDGVFVMTKIGRHQSVVGRLAHSLKRWTKPLMGARARGVARAVRQGNIQTDFSPLALQLATQAAQRRLGGARINALLLHSPPAEILAQPATLQVLQSFKIHGSADWVGVSCDDLATLRVAAAAPAVDMVQMPLPLYQEGARQGVVDRLIEQNVAILLRGVLRDRGGSTPRDALLAAGGLPGVSSVIVGVSSPDHLREIL